MIKNVNESSTQHDGSKSPLNSFQSSSLMNNSNIDKIDQATLTDQIICNCQCDMISKLKQKAHRAFMQVVEIENLYKEQMEQLKDYYEEKQKNQSKKFTYKEERLQEKCKQLEQEIEKIRQAYHRERIYELTEDLQSPFTIDGIQSIIAGTPDDSCESIYQTIKQFITAPKLVDNADRLKSSLKNLVAEGQKKLRQIHTSGTDNPDTFPKDSISFLVTILQQISLQVENIFQFVSSLIDSSVTAYEKFNQIARSASELENRYNKMCLTLQSSQKQAKFMTDYIKKMSQDNLIIKRKNGELERANKNLQQAAKQLKKNVIENKILSQSISFKKEIDVVSSHNIRHSNDSDDLNVSKGSMISSCTAKRSPGVTKMLMPERIFPSSLNFKKKGMGKSQEKP